MYTLRFDGLFRKINNSNLLENAFELHCYGWLLSEGDKIIAQGYGAYESQTEGSSNISEYLALIEGLEALLDLVQMDKRIRVCGDAKSVIDQMRGVSSVNSNRIWRYYDQAMKLANNFIALELVWLPRKYNKEADKLSRLAMKQARFNHKHALRKDEYETEYTDISRNQPMPLYDLRIISKVQEKKFEYYSAIPEYIN
jgi:ribonuclease HI